MSRMVVIIVVALVIIVGGYFLFKSFQDQREKENIQTITITSEEKFDPEKAEISNDRKIQLKNDSSKKQIVKNGNDKIAELDPGQTSGTIELQNDSNNSLVLEGKKNGGAKVVVGVPLEEKQTGSKENKGQGTSTGADGQPLPSTGPGNLFVIPLMIILGLLLRIFHKVELKQT